MNPTQVESAMADRHEEGGIGMCGLAWPASCVAVADSGRDVTIAKRETRVRSIFVGAIPAANRESRRGRAAFSDAPELRAVELLNLPPEWISLPWAQLTSLDLGGQNVAQCVEVLSLTPNLEVLSVDLAALPRNSQPTAVRLDHLNTLKVWISYAKKLSLLAYITVPALKHLHLTLPSDPPIAPLPSLLARSECTLHSISLDANFKFAIPALEAMGMVSEVSLPWTESDLGPFFDRIATDPTFLPHIRSLSLPNCETAIPYTSLCDMLVTRWYERGDQPKLDSFRLIRRGGDADTSPNSTLSDKLCALVDDGLDIHIVSMHDKYYLNYFSF
ncbi:hypothetical protein B0H11DRAFT_2413897 [Mycena galericulata]|nr:hypothetical protein B0H11DRAFT_2413897 [Mycena galericulata]